MTTRPTYDFHIHSYVLLRDDAYPRQILWCDGARVVVGASYNDVLTEAPEHEKLTGFDSEGFLLVRVPVTRVRSFLSEDEAESVVKCVDADERFLSYAR